MKTRWLWTVLSLLCLTPLLLLAADGDPGPEGAPFNGWAYVIPFLTPLVVLGVKKLAPHIPNWLLPTVAPMIGVGLDAVNAALFSVSANTVLGAALGLSGVGLRELVDQLNKARQGMSGTPAETDAYNEQQKAAKAAQGG